MRNRTFRNSGHTQAGIQQARVRMEQKMKAQYYQGLGQRQAGLLWASLLTSRRRGWEQKADGEQVGLAGPLAGGSHSSYAVLTCLVGWTQGFGFSFVNGDSESKDFEWELIFPSIVLNLKPLLFESHSPAQCSAMLVAHRQTLVPLQEEERLLLGWNAEQQPYG